MKIVLDTNIIVAACKGSRQASLLLEACLLGRFIPLVSVALFAEYEDVVNRDDVFSNKDLSRAERNEVLDALLSVCEMVRVFYLWRPNLNDEADNHVVELAVAGGAACIVTRNLKDFKNGEILFPSIKICLPEFLLESLS